MNPKVSVIVPVYNTSKYLREFLNSVIFQSLKEIEIICTNDGSSDNSLEILREYEEKDSRIKVIDKQNEGHGAARNDGVKIATGDFLLFIDSDDFLEPNALETLYNQIKNDDSDVIFYNVNYIYENNTKSKIDVIAPYRARFLGNFFDVKDAFDILYDTTALSFKMYKRSLWVNKGIYYTLHLLGEDSLPYFVYLANCKKVSLCDKPLYNYRRHSNSLSASISNKYNDLFDIFYTCEKFLLETEQGEKLISSYLDNRIRSFIYWYRVLDLKYRHDFYNKVKKVFLYIYQKYGYDKIKNSEYINEFKKIIAMSYFEYRLLNITKTLFVLLKSHVV